MPFLKLYKSRHPEYLYAGISHERQLTYNLKSGRRCEQNMGRTTVQRTLLGIIRTFQKPTYNIHDIGGIGLLNKLRLNFNALNE